MKNLKKHFRITFIIGAVTLTGIVILGNMIFNNIMNRGRFDLTEDRIYSVSPAVKKILSRLEAPIDVTYYVSSSEKMPTQWKNLERDVIDLLQELKLVSQGKLTYTIFDPSKEEEREAYEEGKQEEDQKSSFQEKPKKITRKKIAQELYERGVIPFGVQSTSQDEFAVKRVYSSIVLSYLDRKEDVIEEVRPETFGNLEYEIVSRIYRLISKGRPRIGFYPAIPEIPPQYRQYRQAPPDMYGFAVQLLKESGCDVIRTNIKKDDPVPENIKTMIVMVDQPLNQRQLFEVAKLIHKGVRVIIAGQQHNFQISPSGEPGKFNLIDRAMRLNINELTGQYGFEFDDAIFMDSSKAYIQVPVYQTQRMGGFQVRQQRFEPVTKPVIIRINPEDMNSKLAVSNKITELFYLFGGRLIVNKDLMKQNKLTCKTLFTSSSYSWTQQSTGGGPVDVSLPDPQDILKHQPLGILVEGKFSTQFADGNIPQWPGDNTTEIDQDNLAEKASEITDQPKENKIIAFGCTNLFRDDVIQLVASNRALLINSVEALTLGDELINIRSKTFSARRIKTTSSAGKAASKAFVILFSPLVFVGIGILLTFRRKMK